MSRKRDVLEPGTRVGRYEILGLLGAGGMGEVYRARDERLDREVAIKVLLAAGAQDPDRRQRFEREARAVGALNHPNVLALYDVGDHEGAPYLVSELLDGETLRQRLEATPRLATRKAVDYATRIAQGLAAAHDKGILHRDLKPENLFLTRDGGVKVLDFGLAKLTGPGPESDTEAPTEALYTRAGTVVGTVGYMSPEQVRGREVDHCSDIFAFGAVLYEMLAGRRAFAEETPAETMTAILKHEPELPDSEHRVPLGLERITRRCLEKKPSERFQSARDLAFHLEVQSTASDAVTVATVVADEPRRRWTNRTTLGVLGVVLLTAVGLLVKWPDSTAEPPPVTRLALVFPADAPPSEGLAVSPDGKRIVYGGFFEGQRRLFLRPLDRYDATPIPGTEGGFGPFFSPDGEWVGFYAEGKLKKVAMGGGASVTLDDDSWDAVGADWAADGTIVFVRVVLRGLSQVPANGGTPTPLTVVEASRGEVAHLSPQVLPGDRAVLFTVLRQEGPRIEIVARGSGERKVVVQGGGHARYLETGHIVYVRNGALLAAPFDVGRQEITGPASVVVEGLLMVPYGFYSPFRISGDGTLFYGAKETISTSLARVDRQGRERPLSLKPGLYGTPRLSRDGDRLALTVLEERVGIWLYGLARGEMERFATDGDNHWPVWSPDGERVAFYSNRSGRLGLYWRGVGGAAGAERLIESRNMIRPGSWTPDGRHILYAEFDPESRWDIWLLPVDGDRTPRPFLKTRFDELSPALSADGRLVAYVSNEAGERDISKRWEVYVRPFDDPTARLRISTEGGGTDPVWARDGRELFFREGGNLMAATIHTEPTLAAGPPRVVFDGLAGEHAFDVAPDGSFVVVRRPAAGHALVNVIQGWSRELERQVPVD